MPASPRESGPPASCAACGDLLPQDGRPCETCGAPAGSQGAFPPAGALLLSLLAGAVLTTSLCVLAAIVAAVAVPTGARMQAGLNEERARGALRELSRAQERFRAQDLDRDGQADYGDLAELGVAGAIGPDLASGILHGYAFQMAAAEGAPTERWMAVASPLFQGRTGQHHFAINHRAAVVWRWQPIPLDLAQAELPGDAQPTGAE